MADYRGLSMSEIDALRTEVLKHGATFRVVKNTLTRRAAEAAGQDALLAMLEGPTGIAFLESDGDPVAVAKALSEAARTTKILTIRGGILEGRTLTEQEVEDLAKLPPADVLRGQVLGAILGPLNAIAGLDQRAAAEPVRPDRRPHRAARAAGRHVGGRVPRRPRGAAGSRPPRRKRLQPRRRRQRGSSRRPRRPAHRCSGLRRRGDRRERGREAAAEPEDGEPQQAAEASTEEPAEGAPEEPEETQE